MLHQKQGNCDLRFKDIIIDIGYIFVIIVISLIMGLAKIFKI